MIVQICQRVIIAKSLHHRERERERERERGVMDGIHNRCSRSSSVLLRVLVPLVVVSLLLVLGFDSRRRTTNPWRTPNSDAPPLLKVSSGDNNRQVIGGTEDSFSNPSSSQHAFQASSPAMAPQPGIRSSHVSETKDIGASARSVERRDPQLERLESGLAKARAAIREAIGRRNQASMLADKDYTPNGLIYRNAYAFHRSYLEMEKLFKIYVYEEGEAPIFHSGATMNLYSIEGRFIHNMEMDTQLRTRNPELAHVHFLPISVVNMVLHIYRADNHDRLPIQRTVADYINVIARKYPYWNRSLGADHFMLSCHDWGPFASRANAHLFSNSILVQCNANTSEGFKPDKDVSLPEINIKVDSHEMVIGGPPASGRPILAFFAGGIHGPIRPLLKYWMGRDNDVQIHERLPKGESYADRMKMSKFCLCPSGYEVASSRIVEAIYAECVPVTINDNYVLPFSDVLNWKAFSVQLSPEDIPNLKNILLGISPDEYQKMQLRVRVVLKHFVVNTPPKRYDMYNMILHSVWLRRLNVHIHPED